MPKKFALNEKYRSSNYVIRKVEATERKEAKKVNEKEKIIKAKEEAYWQDDDKNAAKKQERKQQEEEKREQALKNKLEKEKLLQEEEKQIDAAAKKKAAPTSKKVKQYDAAEAQRQALLKSMQKMGVNPDANTNENNEAQNEEVKADGGPQISEVDEIESQQIQQEMEQLDLKEKQVEGSSPDRHPEKRAKAAYLGFEEERLPVLRKEWPTLKLSQLKEKLWKEWRKHPNNPMNFEQ